MAKTTKAPPNNKEVEDRILGVLLIEQNSVHTYIAKITSEFFYQTKNQLIFKAIQSLYDKMSAIDIVTVCQHLTTNEQMETVGGPFEVVKLTNNVTGSSSMNDWILILQQNYLQRKGIVIGQELVNDSYQGEIENHLNNASNKILNAQESIYKNSEKGMAHYIMSLAKERDAVLENGQIGIDTGWESLNKYISGWVNPDLIILAARPAQGKTAFMLNAILNVLRQDKPVGIFSLEMSGEQLVNRLISLDSGIAHHYLRTNNLTEAQKFMLMASEERLQKAKLYIDDTPSLNIRDLRSKAAILKRKYNIEFLCIDYLQLMSGVDRKGNRESEIAEISRGCKIIAKELNIPVMALSQLSRAVESRQDKMPQLSDLRESGGIEQDADSVIFLMRPETYGIKEIEVDGMTYGSEGKCIVKLAKNRHGNLKNIPFQFIGERMEFKEMIL
jgi:replicative DNA helicase